MNIEGGKLVLNQQRLLYKVLGTILVLFQIVSSTNGASNNFSTTNPIHYNEADIGDVVSFDLPIQSPSYPPGQGSGFAIGTIDLGGLVVYEALSFKKIWAINRGGPKDMGASFYEPVSIPEFNLLGHYSRPNSVPLYAAVLTAKDRIGDGLTGLLTRPVNYTLVWSSEGLKISKEGDGYIWLPVPLNNSYKAVGYVVTRSPVMPSVDMVRCVHTNFTDSLEIDTWIWGVKQHKGSDPFNVYSTKPKTRGPLSLSVPAGTFMAQVGDSHSHDVACLKRTDKNPYSAMPRASQIGTMIRAYAPLVYLHPFERYLPSSVQFFFVNGVMLHEEGQKASPIIGDGDNLPSNGSVDDAYLDLPDDEAAKEVIKNGSLQYIMSYVHVKPALGAIFTDVVIWLYYPFNGGAMFQLGPFTIPLGRIGQHVSDWEHITLRIDNFHGMLKAVYLSRHASGTWVSARDFEYKDGTTRPLVYASWHGHAHYVTPSHHLRLALEMDSREIQELEELYDELEMDSGQITKGDKFLGLGILDETAKGGKVFDIASNFQVVRVDHDSFDVEPWVKYTGRWGPKITYRYAREVKAIANRLPHKFRNLAIRVLNKIPPELRGEEAPDGPAMRENWKGDEKV